MVIFVLRNPVTVTYQQQIIIHLKKELCFFMCFTTQATKQKKMAHIMYHL